GLRVVPAWCRAGQRGSAVNSMLMNTLEKLRAGQLAGCRHLKLTCGLKTFPREVFALADTLEILDLSGNELSALPDDLPRLNRLRILFCSANRFTELPAVLGKCPQLSMIGFRANRIGSVPAAALPANLRWLILSDNRVEELPAGLGRCAQLQKLMLAGNRLSDLPPEMAACTRLELLRIAANRFSTLPEFLFSLPRLAWLAYAGNPLGEEGGGAVNEVPIASIAWDEVKLSGKLGEGASGVIHEAQWQSGAGALPVAVKLFKGTLTSDGLPHHEMHACIRAGAHPQLIPVLGRIDSHPENLDGLVMALIDRGFANLAGPPSFESCTRDVYAGDARFSPQAVRYIALGVASAVRHLHAQGILHGDLYAHNILYATDGEVLLGDFGAASFLPRRDRALADALQRIEVRAFACLLEELLERCTPVVDAETITKTLSALQAACARETPAERPLFAEIEQRLSVLNP
ncbi:MAG: leucine-rich repeat-containing protein kinase family protein, partial [Azonexus sp.]